MSEYFINILSSSSSGRMLVFFFFYHFVCFHFVNYFVAVVLTMFSFFTVGCVENSFTFSVIHSLNCYRWNDECVVLSMRNTKYQSELMVRWFNTVYCTIANIIIWYFVIFSVIFDIFDSATSSPKKKNHGSRKAEFVEFALNYQQILWSRFHISNGFLTWMLK